MGQAMVEMPFPGSDGDFFIMKYRINPILFPCPNPHIRDVDDERLSLTDRIKR
jgi:hypothetical protein